MVTHSLRDLADSGGDVAGVDYESMDGGVEELIVGDHGRVLPPTGPIGHAKRDHRVDTGTGQDRSPVTQYRFEVIGVYQLGQDRYPRCGRWSRPRVPRSPGWPRLSSRRSR